MSVNSRRDIGRPAARYPLLFMKRKHSRGIIFHAPPSRISRVRSTFSTGYGKLSPLPSPLTHVRLVDPKLPLLILPFLSFPKVIPWLLRSSFRRVARLTNSSRIRWCNFHWNSCRNGVNSSPWCDNVSSSWHRGFSTDVRWGKAGS